jgi:hypothetical protein
VILKSVRNLEGQRPGADGLFPAARDLPHFLFSHGHGNYLDDRLAPLTMPLTEAQVFALANLY